tara:strand:+ start:3902 stop:6244 length:2343 start_codon:yes stop_codon:yes gene_type:complete
MSRIWSFHGGIHPAENKRQSLQRPLERLPLPERLILPLQQHIGAPAAPIVEIGDQVLKGQIIAEPTGHVSVYLHAPTSGTVTAIGSYAVPHPSGMNELCIVIEPDGQDLWIEHQGIEDFRALEKAELARLIRCAGISGMGGAGFPTAVKLHLSDDHIVNTLIINGVECEPYITADDTLMREQAEDIIGGIEIAAHLIKPTHCLIGIEDNKPEAAMALSRAAGNSDLDIEVVVVPTKYPSGGEKQLIKLLTGVEVPSGRLPADIGIVVQNVGTMAAVNRAVHHGEPLISRITTLTGDALARPGNVEVLIGTPIRALIDYAGADPQQLHRLVMGGPMMGFSLNSDQVPVIKTSNCVIAASAAEFPEPPPAQNCIRCGQCEQACPAELLPQQLYWFAKGKEFDKALSHNLMDCIECGACAYVCPSNIPLVQYYRFAKGEIRREQFEQRNAEQARIRFEARQQRLEREKQEKADKRKARAEVAARTQAERKDTNLASATASTPDPQAQLKLLKTAAAVARTKLSKAEKALAQAQAEGISDLSELQTVADKARANAKKSQQALSSAEQQSPPSPPTLAELKIAAATARTKVSKTAQALADAETKGAPGAEKLRLALDGLNAKALLAQQALDQAQTRLSQKPSSAATSPALDIKQLKTAASIARTKLKKAQKALSDAEQAGTESAELRQQFEQLEQQSKTAEQAYAEAQDNQPQNHAPDLKALKTAAAVARTQIKKTEAALADAQAKGLPSAVALSKGLEKLQTKALGAEQALADAQQQLGTETVD